MVHYITRQPTSATGEVLMFSRNEVTEVFPSYNATDFLAVAFSMKNALMGPIWSNHSIRLPSSKLLGETNPLMDEDIDDSLVGEVAVLMQSGVTDTAGYLIFDYDFTFSEPMYSLHTTSIPISTGPYDIKAFLDTANPVLAASVSWACDSEFSALSNGTVFKVVLNVTGTTFGGVLTAANAFRIVNVTQTENIAVVDGTTLYAVVNGSNLQVYPSLASACIQSSNVFLQYATGAAAKTTWAFTAYMVQIGNTRFVTQA